MTYKKTVYNRKSIRLHGYDYSQQGLYLLPFARTIEHVYLAPLNKVI
ncbi:MAG: hypothetical protein PF481_01925 [Bacteroidales bacterium]|nr:hypothetical protein [Bacteroidales bacterium]